MEIQDQTHEEEINLLDYWNVIWRRKIIVITLCFIAVTATMILSFLSPKFYQSETLIVTTGSESGGLGAALSSLPLAGVLGGGTGGAAEKIMVVLKSRTIAEAVIRKYDLMKVFYEKQWDPVRGAWKAPDKPPLMEDTVRLLASIAKFNKSKEGSITVSVEWKKPQLAADIANYYVFALTEFLKDKSMNITVQVVDKAIPAERKSRPKIRQNMMLAGVASLFIGIFIAFFLDYLAKQKKT